jgi:hypothetical protein
VGQFLFAARVLAATQIRSSFLQKVAETAGRIAARIGVKLCVRIDLSSNWLEEA